MALTTLADGQIPAGSSAPYAIRYDLTSKDPDIDLTDAVSAVFRIQRQKTSAVDELAAVIDLGTLTESFIRLERALNAADFPDCDVVKLIPVVTLGSGGTIVGPVRKINVVDQFDFSGSVVASC